MSEKKTKTGHLFAVQSLKTADFVIILLTETQKCKSVYPLCPYDFDADRRRHFLLHA